MEKRLYKGTSLYFAIVCLPMLFRSFLTILGAVLRAVKDTRTPMYINVFINFLNIILNFLLIYESREVKMGSFQMHLWGAGLGTTGAAIGTAVSFTVGGILILGALWKNSQVSPRGMVWKPDMEIIRSCTRIGLPVALERMVSCFGYLVFTAAVTSLGTVSFAAHTIAETAEQAFYIPGYGMQSAATTLEGNAPGEGNNRKPKKTARILLIMVVIMMGISGAVMFICVHGLMKIFTSDSDVIAIGTVVLRICALTEPIFGAYVISNGIFDGVGDTLPPFIYSFLGMWGIRIPFSWLCVRVWGLDLSAVWVCMVSHNVVTAGMMFIHYCRGKWNPLNNGYREDFWGGLPLKND